MNRRDELPSGEQVLAYAYHLGAEAKANGRRWINWDDREDIARYAGYERWAQLTTGNKNEAIKHFYCGWNAE